MALEVFDYRTDVRNVVIIPEIRARFIRMQPGQTNVPHSHDLGHEVFLVLEGEVEFEIAGQRAVLSPGQMCVAYRDELHAIRCVSDAPATYYISVTPHVEPTHTRWDAHGAKLPPAYGTAARDEREHNDPSAGKSTDQLGDEHVASATALAEAAEQSAGVQTSGASRVKAALATGDADGAKRAVDEMWESMYRTSRALRELETAWNEFSARFSVA